LNYPQIAATTFFALLKRAMAPSKFPLAPSTERK
jgi:hypothetical protein